MTFVLILYIFSTTLSTSINPETSVKSIVEEHGCENENLYKKDRLCQNILDKYTKLGLLQKYNDYLEDGISCYNICELECVNDFSVTKILNKWKRNNLEKGRGYIQFLEEYTFNIFSESNEAKSVYKKCASKCSGVYSQKDNGSYTDDEGVANNCKKVKLEENNMLEGEIENSNESLNEDDSQVESLSEESDMSDWNTLVDSKINENIITFEKILRDSIKVYAISIKIFRNSSELQPAVDNFIETIKPTVKEIITIMGFQKNTSERENILEALNACYKYLLLDFHTGSSIFPAYKHIGVFQERHSQDSDIDGLVDYINTLVKKIIGLVRGSTICFFQYVYHKKTLKGGK